MDIIFDTLKKYNHSLYKSTSPTINSHISDNRTCTAFHMHQQLDMGGSFKNILGGSTESESIKCPIRIHMTHYYYILVLAIGVYRHSRQTNLHSEAHS